ncbi:MAG TPA: tail fiber domain-containing protein [Bryobacteraceae bacterium]
MNANSLCRSISFLTVVPAVLTAQVRQNPNPVVLKHWAAPLYWQPQTVQAPAAADPPANPLVLVAVTPCRVVDTRASQGFPSPFGAPSLVAGASRTFPLPSSTLCPVPAAQAYSLNITVVPSGSTGFLTAYPTGQSLPLAATLVWSGGSLTSNAAIVPGGTNASIDVYVNSATDVVIDINGYYVPDGYVPTGSFNTAVGGGLYSNTTGSQNTAVGQGALFYNTTGSYNTAVGQGALQNNTTGQNNTATGLALNSNTTGSDNTANGAAALFRNTTGSDNAAFGGGALNDNTTGSENTALGSGALNDNTTGTNNIAIGSGAATGVSPGNSNNIHLGSQGLVSDFGVIRIGSAFQTSFFAAGVRGVTTGNNDAVPVVIDSNGQLGTVSSSQRLKEDIHEMGDLSRPLLRLRPVTFRYRKPFNDGSRPIQFGLIAEEVAGVFPDLVARSADGQIETVKYQMLDALLLNELQRQEEEIRALKERLDELETGIK